MYTGWAGPVVPPQDVVSYYEAVTHAMGGSGKTREFLRFFKTEGVVYNTELIAASHDTL